MTIHMYMVQVMGYYMLLRSLLLQHFVNLSFDPLLVVRGVSIFRFLETVEIKIPQNAISCSL